MQDTLKAIWERWPAQMVALVAIAFFTVLTAPTLTWINTNADGSIYLNAARHLMPTHPTGAPAYNILNSAWIHLFPFGDHAWRIALGSAIFAGLTCGLLWKETRSLIPPLIYAGSGLVVSQATIIETYSMVTFCMVGMYVYRSRVGVAVAFAFVGMGVHHLIGLTLIPMILWHRYYAFPLRPYLWLLLSPIWYVWLLTAQPASMYLSDLSLHSLRNYFSGQTGLVLGLAILGEDRQLTADFVNRLVDYVIFIFGGFLAALVPIALRRRNDLLLWLFLLPIIHAFFNLPAVAFVYMMPSFAFGGIMAWDCLRTREAYGKSRALGAVVVAFAIGAVFYNAASYDIGVSLDRDNSAMTFYDSLDELPDDAWVFTDVRGWELTTLHMYSNDTGKPLHGQISAYMLQPIDDMRDEITLAGMECRLFRTVNVDQASYLVDVEATDPWKIWPTLAEHKQIFQNPTERQLEFDLSQTKYGAQGWTYPTDCENTQNELSLQYQ